MSFKVKATFTAVAILFSSLSFAQWSQYPVCSKQYESDRAACNKMQGSKAKKAVGHLHLKDWLIATKPKVLRELLRY